MSSSWDPVLFCEEVLGFTPWHAEGLGCDSQADILRSAAKHRRVAIRSGHKCGKSRMCAALALWEFVCWPGSRTVLTAPTHRQIDEIIWREVRDLHRNARIPIGGVLAKTPGKGLRHPKFGTQVFGFSTNEADKLSGISGSRVTYIVDEASGVDPAIYTAIAGNRMSGARLVLISNPTQPTGEFYAAFHVKAALYVRHHISSLKVAEAVERGDIPRHPGMADAAAVAEFKREYGEGTDDYRVRVEGEFALAGAHAIIRASDYDAAVLRWEPIGNQPEWRRSRLEVGVDVAHMGDDNSVIVARRGRHVYEPETHKQLDGPQLALKVWNYVSSLREHTDQTAVARKPRVRVEAVGVGVSCYDHLRLNYSQWLDVVKFDPASKAAESHKYVNLRAEAWFNAKKVLSTAPYQLPEHHRMREEALSVHYLYDKKNRYQAEPKKSIKKRLGQSPDCGDALIICLWDPPDSFGRAVRIRGL